MCHMYTWCVVGTTVDMSSFKWCQMDCRWFWAWATAVATRWVTQFHRQKCSIKNCKVSKTCEVWNLKRKCVNLDKKYGNEHKLWRSVVEIMAIGSVESKMYFLLWPRTRLSNPLSSKPSSIKKAWIWIKSAAAPLPLLRTPHYLDTYLFALLCHPCFTFTPHPNTTKLSRK